MLQQPSSSASSLELYHHIRPSQAYQTWYTLLVAGTTDDGGLEDSYTICSHTVDQGSTGLYHEGEEWWLYMFLVVAVVVSISCACVDLDAKEDGSGSYAGVRRKARVTESDMRPMTCSAL